MWLSLLKLLFMMALIGGLNYHFKEQGRNRRYPNLYAQYDSLTREVKQELKDNQPIDRHPGQVQDLTGVNIEDR